MPRRRTSKIHTVSDEELKQIIERSRSYSEIMRHLGTNSGSLFPVLKQRVLNLGLAQKFESSQFWNRGKTVLSDERIQSIDRERLLTKDSVLSTSYVKKLLLKEFHVSYECKKCKISLWFGEPISLELDHINGDNRDNRFTNLRLLCPNCHSQTSSWRGRNVNKGKKKVLDETLMQALEHSNYNIRKALISVGLSPKGGNYARCYHLLGQRNDVK